MHEAALVESLLRQVAAIRVAERGVGVEVIRIEIGPLAGVEPLLVQSAFQRAASAWGLSDARLEIDEVPLSADCPTCGVVGVSLPRIVCPDCGATSLRIVAGEEVRLMSVTIRQAEDLKVTP